ncbi:AfsR/SARP family transcriptional regulator [Catenulispora rubra]|uniref:AfsR/SARP family transcriptional regulator n=1 Tax=Catenulispora rubra TaxID=280293 RepID=UPI0018921F88|nr:BTAD domain-containing putative transcriptional regulator [Catenulispora rubra]
MDADLWFTVLGPIRAWRGGSELDLGTPQQRKLLASLLLREGSQISVRELSNMLWGSATPDTATAVIRTYVARLRRELDGSPIRRQDSVIATVQGGYRLVNRPDSFDLAMFRREVSTAEEASKARDPRRAAEHLRTALALWHDEPLAGLLGEHASAERARLELLRLGALSRWFELELELGSHTAIIPELTQLVGQHPLDEHLHELLMLALYRSGRQAQALAIYRNVQEVLAEELGVDPGPDLQRMYGRILQADPDLLATTAEAGTLDNAEEDHEPEPAHTVTVVDRAPDIMGQHPTAPTRLPPRLTVFAGRSRELAAAREMLADPDTRPGTVVVSGMAGVGKTTFAVHWARQIAQHFPDGQFYLNLRGFAPDDDPVDALKAVRTVLEILGLRPGSVPDDLDAAVALYRGVLAERRVLLLLDNARLAAQVRPLLPDSSGSLAVVTSRNRLAGLQILDGARSILLEPLPAAQARELLVRRIGGQRVADEPEVVQEIIDRCGRLPLALSIVAARCATHAQFTLDAATTALRGDLGLARIATSLDALSLYEAYDCDVDPRHVFSWSYRTLSPPAARLFRLAALHPGPDMSIAALASLTGLSRQPTLSHLAELSNAHLLIESAPGRYEFHDLLRAYADELKQRLDPPEEQQQAQLRMLDHYVHSTIAALRQYNDLEPISEAPVLRPAVAVEAFCDRDAALRWYETESPVLMAVAHQARMQDHLEHVWHLAWATDTYHYRSGRGRNAAVMHTWALEAAEYLDRSLWQGISHRFLGDVHADLGSFTESVMHIEAALAIFDTHHDVKRRADCYLTLARVARRQGDGRESIAHLKRAAEIGQHHGDQLLVATALNNMGEQYGDIGEHDTAVKLCREALDLWTELDDQHALANCYDTLGHSVFHLGEHEQAFKYLQYAIDTFQDLGDKGNQANSLSRLGDACAAHGDNAAAIAAWSNAFTILKSLDEADPGELETKLRRAGTYGGVVQ